MNTRIIGNKAEELVSQYLNTNGYEILERNFSCKEGEIDIIAQKNNCICVVEVKSFPQNWELYDLQYKINYKKIMNIKKTFSVYIARNCSKKYNRIRFDVAMVTGQDIKYIEDAF